MNILINGIWYSALEQDNNHLAVEIPNGELPIFNEIYDNAHKTHGKEIIPDIHYAYLHQEPNGKGKVTSKCKVGHFSRCVLNSITPDFHKGMAYAFFSFDKNVEC